MLSTSFSLHKAIFKPNNPVCEAYIIYYTQSGLNAPFDSEAHAKLLASGLGFNNTEPLEILLLGKFRPTKAYPNGVVSHENGEY